jgi:hypothetical protein
MEWISSMCGLEVNEMFRIQNLNTETQRRGVRSAGSRNSAPLRPCGWKGSRIFPAGVLGLLLLLILTAPLQAGKKKAEAAPENLEANRRYFDIAKIVWPSPPAIPRIAFQTIYTGQKIDWAGLQSGQRLRQSWMDRLAGEQPDYQLTNVQQKIGFQLMRVYGVAADSKGNIYAADQGVGAIFIFPHDATGKVQLIKHGVDAHLPMMNGLAMDDDDRLFVTDVKSHNSARVYWFHPPGLRSIVRIDLSMSWTRSRTRYWSSTPTNTPCCDGLEAVERDTD